MEEMIMNQCIEYRVIPGQAGNYHLEIVGGRYGGKPGRNSPCVKRLGYGWYAWCSSLQEIARSQMLR